MACNYGHRAVYVISLFGTKRLRSAKFYKKTKSLIHWTEKETLGSRQLAAWLRPWNASSSCSPLARPNRSHGHRHCCASRRNYYALLNTSSISLLLLTLPFKQLKRHHTKVLLSSHTTLQALLTSMATCYDRYRRVYYTCNSRWHDWGRWVALAVILIIAFLIFFLCA